MLEGQHADLCWRLRAACQHRQTRLNVLLYTLGFWASHSHCPACQLSASYFTHKAFPKGMHSGFWTSFSFCTEGLNGGLELTLCFYTEWMYLSPHHSRVVRLCIYLPVAPVASNKRRHSLTAHQVSLSLFLWSSRLLLTCVCASSCMDVKHVPCRNSHPCRR